MVGGGCVGQVLVVVAEMGVTGVVEGRGGGAAVEQRGGGIGGGGAMLEGGGRAGGVGKGVAVALACLQCLRSRERL